jgi:hypothetical protein
MRRAIALSVTLAVAACSGSNGAPSFLAFAPGALVSAIPLCDDVTDAGDGGELSIDGAIGFAFAGAPHVPHAGLEQCAMICSTATYEISCCLSQWEPQTVVCYP